MSLRSAVDQSATFTSSTVGERNLPNDQPCYFEAKQSGSGEMSGRIVAFVALLLAGGAHPIKD